MRSKIGLIALAAAGVGFLLGTDKGRALVRQANQRLTEGYDRLSGSLPGEPGVPQLVEKALASPHPDTAVAHAFEEAVS